MARTLKWYVAAMDYIRAEVDSKKEAIATCVASADDGRKRPPITEITSGFYEYLGPGRDDGGRRAMFFIGTRDTLLANGFEYQLQEWERTNEDGDGETWKAGELVTCTNCGKDFPASSLNLAGIDAGTGCNIWDCGECSNEEE